MLLRRFTETLESNGIPHTIISDERELKRAIIGEAKKIGTNTALTNPPQLLHQLNIYPYIQPFTGKLKEAILGISIATFGIAETGGVVEVYENEEAKLPSMITRHHFIIVKETTILKDIPDVLQNIPSRQDFSIITGPSKTADIEKIVVNGAHGPQSIHIFIMKGI